MRSSASLKNYITNPAVTVIVVETVPPVIYVMGEVNAAGPQPLNGKTRRPAGARDGRRVQGLRQHQEHRDPPRHADSMQVQLQGRGQGQGRAGVPAAGRHHHRPVGGNEMLHDGQIDDDHLPTRGHQAGSASRLAHVACLLAAAAPAAAQQSRPAGRAPVLADCRAGASRRRSPSGPSTTPTSR